MISEDTHLFGNSNVIHRFLYGGLPPFFLGKDLPERDFQEWIDSYWAKDILELFRLEKKYSFQKFLELLFINSGGLFEATKYAKPCEISRPTVSNYLSVLEQTSTAYTIKPFSTYKPTEIVSLPKIYTFDTGFICFFKGWTHLQPDNMGILWEHYILNEIIARTRKKNIFYWRDKQGHEIDFIFIPHRGRAPITIECKWSSRQYDSKNLQIFRKKYPEGENWVISQDVKKTYCLKSNRVLINFLNLDGMIKKMETLMHRHQEMPPTKVLMDEPPPYKRS